MYPGAQDFVKREPVGPPGEFLVWPREDFTSECMSRYTNWRLEEYMAAVY